MGSATSKILIVFVGFALMLHSVGAQATAKSYICNHHDVPGGWGAFELGCDADQFGDVKRMKAVYAPLIFDRNPEGIEATKEYITNVQAVIKEIAKEYYLKRIPNAKPATLKAWMRTAVAIAAHESKLSHYRFSKDKRYKFMTGDHLLSHGIMQVNQEYHANQGGSDSSFDFVGNVTAALDYYFVKWNDSIKQSCYLTSLGKNPTLDKMLMNRARSAYSSYNSGSSFCRFTDLKATWAGNDKDFAETLLKQPWKKYVTDDNRPSPVNVKCLIDGDDLCAMAKPAREKFLRDRPLVLADGNTCVTADGMNFNCAADTHIFSCLAKIDPDSMDNAPLKLDKLPANAHVTVLKDRAALCQNAVQTLYRVGDMILLKKEILMRDEVGGAPLGNTKAGRIYQVLDYDVRLGDTSERYYQIKTPNGTTGWIYGGTNDDHNEWLQIATPDDVAALQKADEFAKQQLAAQAAAVARASAAAAKASEIVIVGNRKGSLKGPPFGAAKVDLKTEPMISSAKPSLLDFKFPEILIEPATHGTAAKNAAPSKLAGSVDPLAPLAASEPMGDEVDDFGNPVAVLPVKGSIIEIARADGIQMFSKPGAHPSDEKPIFVLAQKARYLVQETSIQGTDNQIYLKVTSGPHVGWIYVGHTTPENSVPQWIKLWQ